jgi:hypothetical protein
VVDFRPAAVRAMLVRGAVAVAEAEAEQALQPTGAAMAVSGVVSSSAAPAAELNRWA